MIGLLATIPASVVAWLVSAALGNHVSDATSFVVSFVVWAIVFVPLFVWIKGLRDG
jgi:hypothetical protein